MQFSNKTTDHLLYSTDKAINMQTRNSFEWSRIISVKGVEGWGENADNYN